MALVEAACRETGVSTVARDDEGRIVGTERTVTATGQVVVDFAPAPTADTTLASAVGGYTLRPQVPSLLGRTTPEWSRALHETLEGLAGDDIRRL